MAAPATTATTGACRIAKRAKDLTSREAGVGSMALVRSIIAFRNSTSTDKPEHLRGELDSSKSQFVPTPIILVSNSAEIGTTSAEVGWEPVDSGRNSSKFEWRTHTQELTHKMRPKSGSTIFCRMFEQPRSGLLGRSWENPVLDLHRTPITTPSKYPKQPGVDVNTRTLRTRRARLSKPLL